MFLLSSLTAALTLALAQAEIEGEPAILLPWVIADHMVLQRDRPVPIWGDCTPGATVVVRFGDSEATTRAANDGSWRVDLPAQVASNRPRPLRIAADSEQLQIEDVLVGDVWLCAGQSNMAFPLSRSIGGSEAMADPAPADLLRLCKRSGATGGGAQRFDQKQLDSIHPDRWYSGSWSSPTPDERAAFSAVGYHFGAKLAAELKVPIGLIDLSVGGSTTEGWIDTASLAGNPELQLLLDDYLATSLTHSFIRNRAAKHLETWIESGSPGPRPRHFFEPGFLFEAGVAPLTPFPIRGVIWYQGESNAELPWLADTLFRLLVESWRTAWNDAELPIHFVQLPGMGRDTWPEFREFQRSWQEIPGVSMAVAIDKGHPTNVHPRDKRPVGERLALSALADTYGMDFDARGPEFVDVRKRGAEMEVRFRHAAGLRWAEGRASSGFEMAGADRRFHPAAATIDGDRVVLVSPEVPRPKFARYAWAPFPDCGLENGAGLPAAPFQTGDWTPLKVACIGDSITAGTGLHAPALESYPARLQALLGDGFEVRNFGRSGSGVVLDTMRGELPRAFRRNREHRDALAYRPDIVIANLGINDVMAWSNSGAQFVDDYEALLDDYRALPDPPEILIWSPIAPLFPGQRFYGDQRVDEIQQALKRIARKKKTTGIDLHEPLVDHPDYFPDGIHPNPAGAALIAAIVRDGLVKAGLAADASPKVRVYVLTGQSNSLGTTADPEAADTSPGDHPADRESRFFWSNRSTRSQALIGDSGGAITSLKVQQGEGRNPSFWGPEFGFARALYDAGEREFLIVKTSRGGGGNRFWSKGSSDDHMYRHVVATVHAAVEALPAGTQFEIAALLYIQGESDSAAEAKAAGSRLDKLVSNLRKDLPSAKRMRLLVAGIAAEGGIRDRVREEQEAMAEGDSLATYVSTLDLRDSLYDGLHFDRDAKLEIGRRIARAWMMLGGPAEFIER